MRRWSFILAAGFLVAGCAGSEPRNPVPHAIASEAEPVGFDNIRMWGDFNDPEMIRNMMTARAQTMRERFSETVQNGETPHLKYLAISGGGQYGAFTAGILTAWSETGTRPEFDAVTGISTGSIIAPFAFLGPDYDHVIEEVYTTTSTDDMIEATVVSGLLSGSALADTTPLKEKIAEYVTADLLEAIAVEHRKGRLLFVGTTNIDVGRSVIWNMGAIAASGRPGALQLFRDVILASSAIPMAFPPVFFDVEANGQTYREMHVDGGVTSQVNILSPQIPNYLLEELIGFDLKRDLYVIVNGAITPPPLVVEPRVHKIGSASINTLWYAQAVGDLYKIHSVSSRDDVETRYTWIPSDFTEMPEEDFDPVFMQKLFAVGQDLMKTDTLWYDAPPYFTAVGSTEFERRGKPLPTLEN